jgi:hypothetical protein
MRTTIDLPEDLLRRIKAGAALNGMKMKDFMTLLLERSIRTGGFDESFGRPKHRKLPVMIPATGRKIPVLTNAEIFEILDREDDAHHGRPS